VIEMTAKRLYRSGKDKIIAGVCGGIAEHFDVDPVIIRLIAVFITLASAGLGIIMYIVAWIIVPVNPEHLKISGKKGE
jgi:phage shock protein C